MVKFFKYIISIITLSILFPGAYCGSVSAEDLYVIYGARGSMTFTTRVPPEGTNYRKIPRTTTTYSKVSIGRGKWRPRPVKSEFDDLINNEAVFHRLEPSLVKAVVHVESAFKADATSEKGAMGLMQLMPGTARRFGVKNAYHPAQNVRGGTNYLRLLLDRYHGNVRLALAAYNAGEGAVDKTMSIPPYRETQEYVSRVLSTWAMYRCHEQGGKCG
jgi:soluble lytic murein transglycosylase-like protein